MTDTPTRFPLAWPAGRPRTKYPKSGQFKMRSPEKGYMVEVTTAVAMSRLEDEVSKLGGVNTLLSSNVNTRLDGRPRSGEQPADPGVCLYFTLKGKPFALACDTYNRVAQNIAALAAHVEATRAIERHGVATAAETLQAFSALPPPMVTPPPVDWRKVFSVAPGAVMTDEEIGALYRIKAKGLANDEQALRTLNIARDLALGEINAGGQARLSGQGAS